MRIRRTNKQVLDDIITGVAKVVAREGISKVTIKNVAKEAKMEVKVVARRFPTDGALMELYAGRMDDFFAACFSQPKGLSKEAYYTRVLENVMKRFNDYPEIRELTLWELNDITPESKESSQKRDDMLLKLIADNFPEAKEGSREEKLRTLIFAVTAGIVYLLLLGKQSSFFGIEFYEDKGKKKLLDASQLLLNEYYQENESNK